MNSSEQLCLACGLCCDGTLFANVRLGSDDSAKKIEALGLPVTVSRGRTPITYFRQPCSALCADRSCRIYADRPGQCRAFECLVLKDTEKKRIPLAAALRLVKDARRKAEKIRQLLRKLGDIDEDRSIEERFRRTLSRLESSRITPAVAATCADLGHAMHRFQLLAHEKFHMKAETARPASK